MINPEYFDENMDCRLNFEQIVDKLLQEEADEQFTDNYSE